MNVLITGSRIWTNIALMEQVMKEHIKNPHEVVLIHGGAMGADMYAEHIAMRMEVSAIKVFKANWVKHGKAAGPIRNQSMLEELNKKNGDFVLAFAKPSLKESRGTADMVKRAQDAGFKVVVIEDAKTQE